LEICRRTWVYRTKYECRECGWRERRSKGYQQANTVREVVVMAEAKEADIKENERRRTIELVFSTLDKRAE